MAVASIFLVVMQELIQENFGRGKRGRARTRIEMLIDPFFYTDNVKRNFQ